MQVRNGNCNNCGQCCGLAVNGIQINPWGDGWPGSLMTWSEEACNQLPILRLIPPPHLSGKTSGKVTVNDKEFTYIWSDGLKKSLEDHSCPFLVDHGDGQFLCGVYGTNHHDIWEKQCQHFPAKEMTLSQVIKTFRKYPECSYYYELKDNG